MTEWADVEAIRQLKYRYERTFEVTLSTADLTSYTVKRGRAYGSPTLPASSDR